MTGVLSGVLAWAKAHVVAATVAGVATLTAGTTGTLAATGAIGPIGPIGAPAETAATPLSPRATDGGSDAAAEELPTAGPADGSDGTTPPAADEPSPQAEDPSGPSAAGAPTAGAAGPGRTGGNAASRGTGGNASSPGALGPGTTAGRGNSSSTPRPGTPEWDDMFESADGGGSPQAPQVGVFLPMPPPPTTPRPQPTGSLPTITPIVLSCRLVQDNNGLGTFEIQVDYRVSGGNYLRAPAVAPSFDGDWPHFNGTTWNSGAFTTTGLGPAAGGEVKALPGNFGFQGLDPSTRDPLGHVFAKNFTTTC
jgi:hypothetical protein